MGLGTGVLRKEFYPVTYILLYLLWQILPIIPVVQHGHSQKNAHSTQMVCNNFLFDYSIGYRTVFNYAANHTTPWLEYLEDLTNFCVLNGAHLSRLSEHSHTSPGVQKPHYCFPWDPTG